MTAPRIPWRGVAVPTEHGGWGLTLEPVALGLAAAPSVAGAALGVAALAAFLFRTPFKVAAGDRRRGRTLPRTRRAVRMALLYGTILAAAIATAVVTAEHAFWPPLAAAVPLMLIQAGYDVRARSRRLVPEVAGPAGIASVAAAIALAGGLAATAAWGLWLIAALRAVVAVVLVRAQLRRAKGQPYRTWPAHATAAAAALLALGAAAAGWVPWLGAAAIAALLPFGWWSLWRPPVRAVVVGWHQTVLGIAVVALAAVGVRTGR
ncbi:MAG: YwiC-like family protein [Actinobacteria bacterium]|nr:YwiC-like family protein [Actinomycetota bacterium]